MSKVFIGGSRHVSRLPKNFKDRLQSVIENQFPIIVGDANGADKAVQKYLADAHYKQVTVYCSGESPRNNLGDWTVWHVDVDKNVKGFSFYAAKDREMAFSADFGLMAWDGKSAGTPLNVLRLIRLGKKAVLYNATDQTVTTLKSDADWQAFLAICAPDIVKDLRERATPEEWNGGKVTQAELFGAISPAVQAETIAETMNNALAVGDTKVIMDLLGQVAKARGMSQIAKETGLAREGLYRALSQEGNPEFSTVVKVMSSVGLKLSIQRLT